MWWIVYGIGAVWVVAALVASVIMGRAIHNADIEDGARILREDTPVNPLLRKPATLE
ncbi:MULTISPECIES: hypothetical protein [unclassified Rhodococcus (in: high G+C Gram-positive bacteria)]|jgi:hypothetical protein|uniref:hypothetical protein n=1 Tax=unclassified Rhodococcus (in: high G+C Gram-positive bacteria) TaxID=192944 RepID=UPI000AAF0853|nr:MULTISPECIES: hypothetical protein [unclassified Rhodococcus (in: high G+C Gram-positive bacteria)]